jgi:hypothetical protein
MKLIRKLAGQRTIPHPPAGAGNLPPRMTPGAICHAYLAPPGGISLTYAK